MGWRYLAFRANGDGTETLLSNDVPIQGGAVEEDLSGPGELRGSIAPQLARLQTSTGEPVFQSWSTVIYPEKDGHIRGGFILVDLIEEGPVLQLDTVGFSGYLAGQPYTEDRSWVQVDPMTIVRHLWAHQQWRQNGNLGVTVDTTTSPVRLGTPQESVKWGEITEAQWNSLRALGWKGKAGDKEERLYPPHEDDATGPYTLQWWKDHDMGKVLDDLALETPFDYLVDHTWDGERVDHFLRLGYPTIGQRRQDLRFMLGENVFTEPQLRYDGDNYASEVITLGAGEGRKMIRGGDDRVTGRLHRAAVVIDKTLRNRKSADAMARLELLARLGEADLDTLVVQEHPHAPLGSFRPGDEILVQAPAGWSGPLELWVRILSVSIRPDTDEATLRVVRTDKVG